MISAEEIMAEILKETPKQGDLEIRDANKELAEQAVEYAKGIAPVRTGAFRDSIHVEERTNATGLPATQVVADVDYANLVEYGTVHMAPQPVFAETAAHFGGDEKPAPQ